MPQSDLPSDNPQRERSYFSDVLLPKLERNRTLIEASAAIGTMGAAIFAGIAVLVSQDGNLANLENARAAVRAAEYAAEANRIALQNAKDDRILADRRYANDVFLQLRTRFLEISTKFPPDFREMTQCFKEGSPEFAIFRDYWYHSFDEWMLTVHAGLGENPEHKWVADYFREAQLGALERPSLRGAFQRMCREGGAFSRGTRGEFANGLWCAYEQKLAERLVKKVGGLTAEQWWEQSLTRWIPEFAPPQSEPTLQHTKLIGAEKQGGDAVIANNPALGNHSRSAESDR